MKTCSKCRLSKAEVDFYIKDKGSGRLHTQCKDCYKIHRKTYAAQHYAKYGESYRLRARLRRIKIKRNLQTNLIEYLSDKACAHCGETDIRVLEFDHIDSDSKLFGISKAIGDGLKWITILDEIQKCQILCSNCHKKRTSTQYGWFKGVGID